VSGDRLAQAERRRERTERRRRIRRQRALVGGGLLLVAVGTIAVATGAFSTTHITKIVRLVVTRPLPSPATSTTTAKAPTASLPAASAGSNGSFTPPASAGTASAGVLRRGAGSSFAALTRRLPGQIGVALAPLGGNGVVVLGDDAPAHGWSTTKVPVLVALLRARGTSGLTSTEQQWAQLAITESDNQSILDLFGDLESLKGGLGGASAYMQELLREGGDDRTVVATAPPPPGAVTTFGQTEWPPGEAVKFFQALGRGCLLPRSQTGYVLNLMEHIIPSESWGLGSSRFGAPVAFKGGWGPELGGYLVRQSGVIDARSSRGVAVSIVAHPPAGGDSFGTGTEMITETAQWLEREVVLSSRHGATCANRTP
jgi:hypothetical protein